MVKKGMLTSLRRQDRRVISKAGTERDVKGFDASQYGGAPLLVKGLSGKDPRNSKALEVCNSILQCETFTKQQINEKIKRKFKHQLKNRAFR